MLSDTLVVRAQPDTPDWPVHPESGVTPRRILNCHPQNKVHHRLLMRGLPGRLRLTQHLTPECFRLSRESTTLDVRETNAATTQSLSTGYPPHSTTRSTRVEDLRRKPGARTGTLRMRAARSISRRCEPQLRATTD